MARESGLDRKALVYETRLALLWLELGDEDDESREAAAHKSAWADGEPVTNWIRPRRFSTNSASRIPICRPTIRKGRRIRLGT